MPHLYVDISAHGFGHLAQTAPVLNLLRERLPDLRLTVRSGLPLAQLQRRILGEFTHHPEASDFGLVMRNALEVDQDASLARYRAFHANWESRIEHAAQDLLHDPSDLVLSNISYLSLAAAHQAGIPSLAMCSLNWAEIILPYLQMAPEVPAIREQMLAAYGRASRFLRPTPGMRMANLNNLQAIGPIARTGQNQRETLLNCFSLAPDIQLVLIAMGGVDIRFAPDTWPDLPGIRYLAPRASGLSPHPAVLPLEDCGLDFIDLVASCDGILTKSGYGAFVEAAVCGKPVMYVTRPDWPEEPCLREWLHHQVPAHPITRTELAQGKFGPALYRLLAMDRPQPLVPNGITEAADAIQQHMRNQGK